MQLTQTAQTSARRARYPTQAFWTTAALSAVLVIGGLVWEGSAAVVSTGTLHRAAAIIVFLGTYAVVAVGKLPGLHLDRTGAALLGAGLMVACGALTPEQAYRAVDLGTLSLLLGMMVLVAHLRLAGFFGVITRIAANRARHPALLLVAVVIVSGGLSAVLVNDAVCIAITPLVIVLAHALRRDPLPYLLALAMAANVGSVATLTGNPQNMLVGGISGIRYGAFAANLAPVAGLGLLATALLTLLFYPREFWANGRISPDDAPSRSRTHRSLILKSVSVAAAVIIALFAGVPPPEAALVGGGLLLLIGGVKPEKIWREVDWPLLVMFAGLFVVVVGFERSVLTPEILASVRGLGLGDRVRLAVATAALSNLVSNVPAVLVLRPFIAPLSDGQHTWLVVAMSSTLAGNLTLVGSVANLIVAQRALANGVRIGFWRYTALGAPVTVLTIAIGLLWLAQK